jgi:3-oxoacyl-(acyl-carrier-protein) synthase
MRTKFNKINDWHLLGAAGAVETISSILSMKYGIVPPQSIISQMMKILIPN